MIITKGKHIGRDVCGLNDNELVGLCFAWRNKDYGLSESCRIELASRHGKDVADQLVDIHEQKIRTGEYKSLPYQPKPTTPFSSCNSCGRKCEVLIERICAECYGPMACLDDGMSHILNTQRRIDRYFKMGLNLEIVSTGKYKCLITGVRVTSNGHWTFDGVSGKGVVSLKKTLKASNVSIP